MFIFAFYICILQINAQRNSNFAVTYHMSESNNFKIKLIKLKQRICEKNY